MNPPLIAASSRGDLPMVRALLNIGIDPNITDEDKWTPLHWAVQGVHLAVVRELLDHGANPNIPDEDGITPRDAADLDICLLVNENISLLDFQEIVALLEGNQDLKDPGYN